MTIKFFFMNEGRKRVSVAETGYYSTLIPAIGRVLGTEVKAYKTFSISRSEIYSLYMYFALLKRRLLPKKENLVDISIRRIKEKGISPSKTTQVCEIVSLLEDLFKKSFLYDIKFILS